MRRTNCLVKGQAIALMKTSSVSGPKFFGDLTDEDQFPAPSAEQGLSKAPPDLSEPSPAPSVEQGSPGSLPDSPAPTSAGKHGRKKLGKCRRQKAKTVPLTKFLAQEAQGLRKVSDADGPTADDALNIDSNRSVDNNLSVVSDCNYVVSPIDNPFFLRARLAEPTGGGSMGGSIGDTTELQSETTLH